MKRGLIWFTEDLRVDDNETLCKAILENDEVVPVYFMDHLLEKPWLGIERVGPQRKEFLLQALQSLKKELVARGGDLLVVEGSSLTHLPLLCKQFGIRKVYTKKQVGSEEKFRQNVLRKEVLALGVDFETYSTSTLYHPDDLPFSVRDIPLLFTKFRKLAEKECKVREAFNAPERLAVPIFDSNIPTFGASRTPEWMVGGELEAMKRLKHFVWESKAILSYKETRDQLDGLDYSSKFSAWLSHGCISPRRIYQEIKIFEREFKANESTYWLVF